VFLVVVRCWYVETAIFLGASPRSFQPAVSVEMTNGQARSPSRKQWML
jgi:hypothetical protein